MAQRCGRIVRSRRPRGCLWFNHQLWLRFLEGGLGLTTASRGQLHQSEDGIVGWNGLEGDVRVPANLSVLLLLALGEELRLRVDVDLLRLCR